MFMCVHASAHCMCTMCMQMSVCVCQKVSDPLAVELQMVVSHQMRMLKTEPSSSERAASAPKC